MHAAIAAAPAPCCAEIVLTSGVLPRGGGVAVLPAAPCCAARSDRDRVAQAFVAAAIRLALPAAPPEVLLPSPSALAEPAPFPAYRGRHRRGCPDRVGALPRSARP